MVVAEIRSDFWIISISIIDPNGQCVILQSISFFNEYPPTFNIYKIIELKKP